MSNKTYRDRILEVLECSLFPLSGREISIMARLNYKQTIDALDALYNLGKVRRIGRKAIARWERVEPLAQMADPLNDVMRAMMMASC